MSLGKLGRERLLGDWGAPRPSVPEELGNEVVIAVRRLQRALVPYEERLRLEGTGMVSRDGRQLPDFLRTRPVARTFREALLLLASARTPEEVWGRARYVRWCVDHGEPAWGREDERLGDALRTVREAVALVEAARRRTRESQQAARQQQGARKAQRGFQQAGKGRRA
ncbi:hypothetical protein [Streptomyces sp. NPDC088816]|uniref:hypothetical protein n=1 Tax=Streptomyces sp. NPDC088816 TaxID=3365906 RepID=UPI0038211D81